MKKIIIKLMVTVCCLSFAASAFAVTTIDASTQLGGGTFSPSAKVTIKVIADATAYSVSSQHLNGKKQFASTSTDPKIYYADAATSGPTAPASATGLPTGTWLSY
jgi:hypothetical protein